MLSGCDMLSQSVSVSYVVGPCSHVVVLNGLPEAAVANNFAKGFFSVDESAHYSPTHALQRAGKCGLKQILEGRGMGTP